MTLSKDSGVTGTLPSGSVSLPALTGAEAPVKKQQRRHWRRGQALYPMKGVRNHHRKLMYLKDQEDGLQEDQHSGEEKGREPSANLGFGKLSG